MPDYRYLGLAGSPDKLFLCNSTVRIILQLVKKNLCPLCCLHLLWGGETKSGAKEGNLFTAIEVVEDPNHLLHLLKRDGAWHQKNWNSQLQDE